MKAIHFVLRVVFCLLVAGSFGLVGVITWLAVTGQIPVNGP